MPQSFNRLLTHVVFAPRWRRPCLAEHVRPRLFAYIHGVCRNVNAPLIIAGGSVDHVHLLIDPHPSVALADAVRDVKANSSRWVHETFPYLRDFAWQTGYSAFAVSWTVRDEVRRYIENQEQHHRSRSFIEELHELFTRCGWSTEEIGGFD